MAAQILAPVAVCASATAVMAQSFTGSSPDGDTFTQPASDVPFSEGGPVAPASGSDEMLPQLVPGITNEGLTFAILIGVLIVGLIAILRRGWAMNDEYARIEAATRQAARMRGDGPVEDIPETGAPTEPRLKLAGEGSFSKRADALHADKHGDSA